MIWNISYQLAQLLAETCVYPKDYRQYYRSTLLSPVSSMFIKYLCTLSTMQVDCNDNNMKHFNTGTINQQAIVCKQLKCQHVIGNDGVLVPTNYRVIVLMYVAYLIMNTKARLGHFTFHFIATIFKLFKTQYGDY